MIAIADIGIGTSASVKNMLDYLRADSRIVTDPNELKTCKKLILPGVGSYSKGTECLDANGWRSAILEFSNNKPLLGICLGMQLLGISSEEGPGSGLGILDFEIKSLDSDSLNKKIHMGWNTVNWKNGRMSADDERFYFVHGYALLDEFSYTIGTTNHAKTFTSALRFKNITGYQFHPEKSHIFGMRILEEFARGEFS